MIIDDITELIIQRTLTEGGKVYALNATEKFNVVSASDNQITIDSNTYEFAVGDKISIIYEPKYSSAWCNEYSDLDGDGIIDLVDLDKDGDGVIDPRAPFSPSHIISRIITAPNAVTILGIEKAPNKVFAKAREWGKPLVIDGYYPLYITEPEALWASPMATPEAHPHDMSEEHDGEIHQWEYWMPHGVNQWHGNYSNCPPMDLVSLLVQAVETYDWEYVDRTYWQGKFSSIVPYDYIERRLGLDSDENGTFDKEEIYRLDDIYNIKDTIDQNGNVTERGDFSSAHYITIPEQAWTYEVVSKDTSENILPDGHSFQFNNYVLNIETYTKFDVGTQEAKDHTLSKLGYYSRQGNGNNASFDSIGGLVLEYKYNNQWYTKNILEVNDQGYIVLEEDIFNVGDRFYLYIEEFPSAPSIISVTSTNPTESVSNVQAIKLPEKPRTLLEVQARKLPLPDAPSFVEVQTGVEEQDIVWDQFT